LVKVDISRLCRRLGYEFKDSSYLKQALTHRSAAALNNERLEFLGDSILGFVIASELYNRFNCQTEGKLSRLRAFLVKGEMLADIALEINLGDYLNLGQGELKSGGFRRASILADTLEAVFAAIYLDGGIESAKKAILHLYSSRLEDPSLQDSLKDAKTQLQEYLQANKYPLPEYELTAVEGEEHDQVFHVQCTVPALKVNSTGHGNTRRKAEQEAAKRMFKQIINKL